MQENSEKTDREVILAGRRPKNPEYTCEPANDIPDYPQTAALIRTGETSAKQKQSLCRGVRYGIAPQVKARI